MTVKYSIPAKLVSIVFVSIAITFVAKYDDSQDKNKQLEETIQLDKKIYTNDLKEIFNRYDSAVLKNKELVALKTLNPKAESANAKKHSENTEKAINNTKLKILLLITTTVKYLACKGFNGTSSNLGNSLISMASLMNFCIILFYFLDFQLPTSNFQHQTPIQKNLNQTVFVCVIEFKENKSHHREGK